MSSTPPSITGVEAEPSSIVQFNVSKMKFPWSDERFDSFRELLTHAHDEAQNADGFIERIEGEFFDAGFIQPYVGFRALKIDDCDQDLIMGNISRWRSRRELHEFTFNNPVHQEVFRRRKEWFDTWTPGNMHHVMWFFAEGAETNLEEPMPFQGEMSLQEARIRLAALNTWGATPRHFDWGYQF